MGIDANEDVSSLVGSPSRAFQRVGLHEAILDRHSHLPTAATYHRNLQGYPIDGIYASPGVTIKAGGYYDFDDHITSTHRGLWIDFDLDSVLGVG